MEASQCAKQFVPLLLVYALPFSLSSLLCATSDSDYNNFVHCLTKHSCPNDRITSIIYSPQNSSYKSVLQPYTKNLQFNASTTPKPIIIVTPLQESHVTQAPYFVQKAWESNSKYEVVGMITMEFLMFLTRNSSFLLCSIFS